MNEVLHQLIDIGVRVYADTFGESEIVGEQGISTVYYTGYSLAVEQLNPEIIGIEVNLVPNEVVPFLQQHIQNPPKSTLGNFFLEG